MSVLRLFLFLLLVQHQNQWKQRGAEAICSHILCNLFQHRSKGWAAPWTLHCLYPCNTCRVGGWVAVQHLQAFGIQFHDSQSGLSHLSQRLSVIAAGEIKAMHASSIGQNHTITWKIYFFCLTHKCGSRIFRRGYSSFKERIKIVPAKELKNLQREEETLKSVLLMRVLLKKKWMFSQRAEFKLKHKVLIKSPCCCQLLLSLDWSFCLINSKALIVAT